MKETDAEAIPKDLVAASATPLVLALLKAGETYGYEILQKVKEISGERLRWTDGMLYPVLHRLERNGLIESQWRETEAGRRRKYYRITAEGTRALDVQRSQWETVHDALRKAWGDLCSALAVARPRGGTPCSI
jgi:DNA-binding PadR family transcriptional regulator